MTVSWSKTALVRGSLIVRLNPGIFKIFKLSEWNLNLNSSDCRVSKIISNHTKLEPISWELNIENRFLNICVVFQNRKSQFYSKIYWFKIVYINIIVVKWLFTVLGTMYIQYYKCSIPISCHCSKNQIDQKLISRSIFFSAWDQVLSSQQDPILWTSPFEQHSCLNKIIGHRSLNPTPTYRSGA